MPLFRYLASDRNGKKNSETVEADSEHQVRASLLEQGLTVEQVQQIDTPPLGAELTPGSLEHTIVLLMTEGRKIEAVKFYRDQKHTDLKDAKEAVEQIALVHGVQPRSFNIGCGTTVFLFVAIIALFRAAVMLGP